MKRLGGTAIDSGSDEKPPFPFLPPRPADFNLELWMRLALGAWALLYFMEERKAARLLRFYRSVGVGI